MKIVSGFVKTNIDGKAVVVSVGGATNIFNGMIKLNELGEIIWDLLENNVENKEVILNKICDTYDVDLDIAKRDLDNFLGMLEEKGIIE